MGSSRMGGALSSAASALAMMRLSSAGYVHSSRGCGWGLMLSCPSGERGMGTPSALRLTAPVPELPPLLRAVAQILQRAT